MYVCCCNISAVYIYTFIKKRFLLYYKQTVQFYVYIFHVSVYVCVSPSIVKVPALILCTSAATGSRPPGEKGARPDTRQY